MAFFGLTQLGYQDAIREHMRDPPKTPQHTYRSGEYRNASNKVNLPPIENKKPAQASVIPTDQLSGYGAGHQGSHVEFVRLRKKHIRNPTDNAQTYRWPPVTSGQVGIWRKDEPLKQNEPWTYVPRHVHMNSEMTRFVNQMSLTNREFSLF